MTAGSEGPDLQAAVRRQVGIATLRRLRRLVDADAARQTEEARWARRLAWAFVLLAAAFTVALVTVG